MENQHRLITGYRDLSQEEIDLMNEIKAEGERLRALVVKVSNTPEVVDHEWADIATTDFQTGLMALARAVACPKTF